MSLHVQSTPANSMLAACLICLSLLMTLPAAAATRIWNGASTNWNDGANWGGIVPGNGDTVVVPNTATKPTMASGNYPLTGAFAAFEVQAGAIVTCLGDITAVNTNSGGTVAVPHGTGVAINCQSATIDGTLNADGRGFPGASNGNRGPGSGDYYDGAYGGGTAPLYGSLINPTALGSGSCTYMPGGGAIKIAVVNTLTLNGNVTANGQGNNQAGSSGGSIWLLCNQFAGTGTISAVGGSSFRGDALPYHGGGGRISVECQTNMFQGAIKAGCGSSASGKTQAGTLWFPKWFAGREGSRASPVDLCLPGPDFGVRYWFANNIVTQFWNVYMTNSWLELYAGSVAISSFAATNSYTSFRNETNMINLAIYGNIFLTNSPLYLPPNGVYDMSGDIVLTDTNSIIYAPPGDTSAINADSGGTESIKHGAGLVISCRNAFISGKIDCYSGGFGPGDAWRGPGGYPNAPMYNGSYGGIGLGGVRCYGSLTRPTALGSAGLYQSIGGGAVKLTATGTLTVNGWITANGYTYNNGGSSGGSVWLQAGTFAGNGLISADAPLTSIVPLTAYGGGGGGRIAIEYGTWNFTGTNSVRGGTTAGNPTPGKTGTVFFCQSPWLGTTTSNGVNGRRLDTQFSVSSNNVRIARSITRFDTSLQWSDYSTDTSGSAVVPNQATYNISGLRRSRGYVIHLDGVPQFGGKSFTSTNGVLIFTNSLDMLHTFFVTPAEKGTIFRGR